MRLTKVLLLVLALQMPVTGWCQEQRLKLEGVWDGQTFQVDRIKERNSSKDVRKIRVAGAVSSISYANRAVQIGPARLRWDASQEAIFADMKVGDVVSMDAIQVGPENFAITSIDPTQVASSDSIELIGALTGYSNRDEWTDLFVAGIPARIPKRLFSNGRLRLQRLGDRRPENQFTTSIGGVRTTIGGEFGLKANAREDRDLDNTVTDGRLDAEAELKLEAFFEISDSVSGFAEIAGQQARRYNSTLDLEQSQFELKRGLLWLFVDQPFGLPAGIQIGRQNIAENREWWWDTDLDAIRAYVTSRNFLLELAIAEELGREVVSGDLGDAEDLDVRRLFLTARLRLSSLLSFDVFLLHQNDHSSSFRVADVIAADQLDEDDANLSWVGVRLSGAADLGSGLETKYWLDVARVSGTEIQYDFDDFGAGELVVESSLEQQRSGTGFDVGATFKWSGARLFGLSEPALTFGYAGGSGNGRSDGTFRQTGLHDNNNKFGGVNRFRYYGELSRPDLENIRISTLSVGFRIGEDSSIELVHHNYQQEFSQAAHPLRVRPDANGLFADLGDELDLVIGIEKWEHFEFEAIGAYFAPGPAFDSSDPSWFLSFKLNYNF